MATYWTAVHGNVGVLERIPANDTLTLDPGRAFATLQTISAGASGVILYSLPITSWPEKETEITSLTVHFKSSNAAITQYDIYEPGEVGLVCTGIGPWDKTFTDPFRESLHLKESLAYLIALTVKLDNFESNMQLASVSLNHDTKTKE
ncbi:hypothetical protein BDZ91DRAFT_745106 [Kalaharituber pfeilii]|nr:hypothetical protein BDZ91DRAFT_745106 [Kalaharituber pfeilii]